MRNGDVSVMNDRGDDGQRDRDVEGYVFGWCEPAFRLWGVPMQKIDYAKLLGFAV